MLVVGISVDDHVSASFEAGLKACHIGDCETAVASMTNDMVDTVFLSDTGGLICLAVVNDEPLDFVQSKVRNVAGLEV